MTQAANDNSPAGHGPRQDGGAPTATTWYPVSERLPTGYELLLWVYGPFVGQWDEENGVWVDKTSRTRLSPIRFWCPIVPP